MVFGGTATIVSLVCLAWVREMVGGFLGLFGADREGQGVKVSIIVVAVLFVYILDFSINTGMVPVPPNMISTNSSKYKLELELSS